jgi:hypothetical protein
MFGFKQRRRKRIRERPFPARWLEIVERNFPYYRQLTPAEQSELRGHVQVFLDEKRFEGCGGLELTDEMCVTVAAQACLLLLNRETDYYPLMTTILVYPGHYFAPETRHMPDGTIMEKISGREGESWHRGPVVLSWGDVQRDMANPGDGRNVVFHEFAHQLDSESGSEEGAPELSQRAMYADWSEVLGGEYERLRDDISSNRGHVIDDYGATSPAEFFAVVTEVFFVKPAALRQHHPELYEQLKTFYRQDPAARAEEHHQRRNS